MKYYLNTFIVYSVIGYIVETSIKYFFIKNMNNGFLYGPWIPVYGFGVCIIIFISKLVFSKLKSNHFIKNIILFLLSMITLTILEFIGGNIIHMLTGRIFWDYSNLKFNFGPYIALEISLVWGIMSLVIVYLINPIVDKIIKKIPYLITYFLIICIFVDFIISSLF